MVWIEHAVTVTVINEYWVIVLLIIVNNRLDIYHIGLLENTRIKHTSMHYRALKYNFGISNCEICNA